MYDAGSAVMQVVPGFAGVDAAIRREASRWGTSAGRNFADSFRRQVAGIRVAAPRIDVDTTTAKAKIDQLGRQLAGLGGRQSRVAVDADTSGATTGLARVESAVRRVSGQTATINVDVDGAGATGQLAAIRGAAFGSITGMQALISAGALLGPVIVPAAAAAAAAVAAIGPAALAGAAGIGVAALGFVGVAGALKQMNAVQDQASQSAATLAGQQAAVASAERSLANTRASNADAARRAAQQVTEAQRTLTAAERDALAVRRELSRAQLEARRALEDLASQVRGNALDQQQANLDVVEARAELDRVRNNPAATAAERQQAEITYQRQVLQVEDLRRRGERLKADQKAANKAGVEGSEQVRAARERIAQADQRVADAQRGVAEARQAQQTQARQAAFALASAQQAVANATRAAGVGGTAAMLKLKQAMADLTPEGRKFTTFLFGLKDEFLGLRQAAERGLLPGVQAGIQALLPYMPQISKFIGQIGKALGDVAAMVGKSLASPFWAEFFAWLGATAGPMLMKFGKIFMAVLEGVAALMMAFAPVTDDIVDALVGFAEGFADWAKTFAKSQAFQDFIAYVTANAPLLGKLFVDLLKVGLKLLIGLAPLAESLLEGLVKVFDWLAKQDPKVLLGIASAVAAIVAGIVALVTGPIGAIGAIVTAFVLVAGAVEAAYNRFETFRKVTDFLRTAVAGYFGALWSAAKAAFAGIAAAVSVAWDGVLRPAFEGIRWFVSNVLGPVFTWLYNNVIKPVWGSIAKFIEVAWAIIRVVFGLIQIYIKAYLAPLFTWLYQNVIRPVWGGIVTQIKVAWALIKPVLSALGGFISKYVVPAFKAGVDAIGKAWDKIKDVAKVPVRFVVETVLNKGIIDNYNRIADKFGVSKVDRVPLPKGFARGGVLPGYTPGRDVHRFLGPGGMALDLSGGEAILRPEATRALGREWVDGINAAARRGGAKGVRRVLGYAGGGILDDLGGLFSRARKKATDAITGAKDLLTDPAGGLRRLAAKLIGLIPGGGTGFGQLIAGLPRKLVDVIADRVASFFGAGEDGGPGSAASPFGGSAGMMRVLRAVFPGLRLISGFRPGSRTLSGNVSYHSADRAVDLPPRRDVAEYIFRNFRAITKELITPFQEFNLWQGRPHTYTGAVWAQHNFAGGNAHDHWAAKTGGILPPVGTYDSGGLLPPGVTTVINGTGRPEPVLTSAQFAAMAAGRTGGLDLRVVVDNGVVSGLVRVEVDNAFGALADARVYNTA